MRRLVAPLAMASAACTLRPWTPSVSVTEAAQDVPDARATALPSTEAVAARWLLAPASPWAPFSKPTLFSALDAMQPMAYLPDVRELTVVGAAERAAAAVGVAGLPEATAWVLDLRGAASVAFVAALARASREPVAPILTFNNWPAPDELVPAEETLAALVAMTPDALPESTACPVFLLDAWRLAYRFDTPDDDTADNRYMLGPSDFPSGSLLRLRGITRAIYVVDDLHETETEEDDLHLTFLGWQSEGIALYVVDLAFLLGTPRPPRWDERLLDQPLVVTPRPTIVDDPGFYARARGGFGGIYGRPSLGPGFRAHWHGGGRAGTHGAGPHGGAGHSVGGHAGSRHGGGRGG